MSLFSKFKPQVPKRGRIDRRLLTLLGITVSLPFCVSTALASFSSDPTPAMNKRSIEVRKVKLFIVEGTGGTKSENYAMGVLYDRYQGPKYYSNGPAWDCHDCLQIMMNVATNMCDSLRSGEATHIALAGNSRGAYLTRAAVVKADRDICPEFDPDSKLVWGGFVDPIPWAMRESNLVNDWGNWRQGVPGINIVKERNGYALWGGSCYMQSFPAHYLPTVVVNVCHGWLNGGSTQSPSMQDFILGRLIASAKSVAEMSFSPIPPIVDAPYGCRLETPLFRPAYEVCGVARVSERPASN